MNENPYEAPKSIQCQPSAIAEFLGRCAYAAAFPFTDRTCITKIGDDGSERCLTQDEYDALAVDVLKHPLAWWPAAAVGVLVGFLIYTVLVRVVA